MEEVLAFVQGAIHFSQGVHWYFNRGQHDRVGEQIHHLGQNLYSAEDRLNAILGQQANAANALEQPRSRPIMVPTTITLGPETKDINWSQCILVGTYFVFGLCVWRSKLSSTPAQNETPAEGGNLENDVSTEGSEGLDTLDGDGVESFDSGMVVDGKDVDIPESPDTSISFDQVVTVVNLVGRAFVYAQQPIVLACILSGPILMHMKHSLSQEKRHGTIEHYATSYWLGLGQHPDVQPCDIFGIGD